VRNHTHTAERIGKDALSLEAPFPGIYQVNWTPPRPAMTSEAE